MECINFQQIIKQEFENDQIFDFELSGKPAQVTIKKINFAIRNKIDKLRQIGTKTKYEYETITVDGVEDLRMKSATAETDESAIEAEEKAIDMILAYGLDSQRQNLKKEGMSLKDWKDLATYYPTEFKSIIAAVFDFNGLAGKKL